jgi:tetratricopeptide (TPR) repeat protein
MTVMCVAILLGAAGEIARAQSPPPPRPAQAAPKSPAAKPAAAGSAQFDALVQQATAARQAQQWEEAAELFTRAVKLRPEYAEGYWYQGAAYYQLDKFAECKESFRRVTKLTPKNGAAFAFLGLCEKGAKEYDRALQHLVQSRILGVPDKELGSVARYNAAVLMTRVQQYQQALLTLGEFGSDGTDNPRIIEAMGIAALRMPMLPEEVPPDRREMVLMAGRGSYMMATRQTAGAAKAFEGLVARYPETPNVHYAYAVYLLIEQPAQAIEEFKKELTIQPNDAESLMQIAYEYLKQSNAAEALPWAQKAVDAAPTNYASHRALGEALVETGDTTAGIAHLEQSIKLAPDSPSGHFALAKAYQRVGRSADAQRERDEFTRLDRLARTTQLGSQSVGGKESERVQPVPPGSQQQ